MRARSFKRNAVSSRDTQGTTELVKRRRRWDDINVDIERRRCEAGRICSADLKFMTCEHNIQSLDL